MRTFYGFTFHVISEKTLCSKDFNNNLRDIHIIIMPSNLVTNLLLFFCFPFVKTKQQESIFQQVGDLVTKNIHIFS